MKKRQQNCPFLRNSKICTHIREERIVKAVCPFKIKENCRYYQLSKTKVKDDSEASEGLGDTNE